jgi:hypothetical protein
VTLKGLGTVKVGEVFRVLGPNSFGRPRASGFGHPRVHGPSWAPSQTRLAFQPCVEHCVACAPPKKEEYVFV